MAKRVSKNVIAAFLAILTLILFAAFPLSAANAETAGANSERITALADYDNCLTESEESALMARLSETASAAGCGVGIVITSDLNGMSDKEYADRFLDENFGAGSDAVVLLLLNSYNKPEYDQYTDRISTSGKMIGKLQNHVNEIFDLIYKKMGDPKGDKHAFNESTGTYGGYDFVSACEEFAASVTRYGAKFVLDSDGVDPGFNSGTAIVSADVFVSWLSELKASILKLLGGLIFG